jgi:hypothetical protein
MAGVGNEAQHPTNVTNTNLEQVSDWLTKILIGAGLAELTSIPGGLDQCGGYVAPALGGG